MLRIEIFKKFQQILAWSFFLILAHPLYYYIIILLYINYLLILFKKITKCFLSTSILIIKSTILIILGYLQFFIFPFFFYNLKFNTKIFII